MLPGRGEHPGIYQRLGTRLAAEGYHVVATRVDEAAEVIASAEGPVVLLGSDTGAAAALALAEIPGVRGAIAAGLPHGAGPTLPWREELAARTSCPVYRELLEADAHFVRGALNTEPDVVLVSEIAVPALLLHGTNDSVADIAIARVIAERLRARFVEVEGAHDILNDTTHDAAADEVLRFLGRVHADAVLVRA
ncbi:alpha/beta hydrolase [Actinokineospora terrae]|uniref:alpha/beta hydrolase n=1 Tax=Actinokineospora terrae TaxID=155974 RepID=UPI001C42FB61|nr:lysophospholipase [Actinokineospora terrae]